MPISSTGWYESVPLDRVEWYTSDASRRDADHAEAPRQIGAPPAVYVSPRRARRPRLGRVGITFGCITAGGGAGVAFAIAEHASLHAAVAEIVCGITAGWIAADVGKAYQRSRRYL